MFWIVQRQEIRWHSAHAINSKAPWRRSSTAVVPDPKKTPDKHLEEAEKLRDFFRSPETQAFIAEFGKWKYDPRPLFFPLDSLLLSEPK